MMALIGWVVCVLIMCKLSLVAFLVMINCTGTYNIGGAVNQPATKFKAWLFAVAVAFAWYFIVINFPFTVSAK